MKLMDAGYRKYGEVFTVPVLNKKITFLLGPDVSSHFFKATDDELGQKEVNIYLFLCCVVIEQKLFLLFYIE